MGTIHQRKPKYQLNEEERSFIKDLAENILKSARMLGVGVDTYEALISPVGGVSMNTINRVRERIQILKSNQ
jgi:hypothetical protein